VFPVLVGCGGEGAIEIMTIVMGITAVGRLMRGEEREITARSICAGFSGTFRWQEDGQVVA
jgi:hypothetical protein